jgi:hypothetical protein
MHCALVALGVAVKRRSILNEEQRTDTHDWGSFLLELGYSGVRPSPYLSYFMRRL